MADVDVIATEERLSGKEAAQTETTNQEPEKGWEDYKREGDAAEARARRTKIPSFADAQAAHEKRQEALNKGEEAPEVEDEPEASPEASTLPELSNQELVQEEIGRHFDGVQDQQKIIDDLDLKAAMVRDPGLFGQQGHTLTVDEFLEFRRAQESPEAMRALESKLAAQKQAEIAAQGVHFTAMQTWKQHLAQTAPQTGPNAVSTGANYTERPDVATFVGTTEEYESAMEQWSQQETQRARMEGEQAARQAAAVERVSAEASELRTRHGNFDAVVRSGYEYIQQRPQLAAFEAAVLTPALLNLPNAAAVAYDLLKSPQSLERLAQLEPAQLFAEIGRLSERVSRGSQRRTGAPKPIVPVEGRASVGAYDPNDPSESPETWARRRNEELRKRHLSR